ncbi:MAG: hypothetical protein OEZ43_11945 [Gammaproteobacteria bacterium]|nr:hypothetical protein [Gammaproteobacteria bacterium]
MRQQIKGFKGYRHLFLVIAVLISVNTLHAEIIPPDAEYGCACLNISKTRSVDVVLACYTDPRCYDYRTELKITLRSLGRDVGESLKHYIALVNNPILDVKERQDLLHRIDLSRHRLELLRDAINFSGYEDLIEPLYVDFDNPEKNYHRHYYSFNVGYEYVSLDTIFQKGFPRAGFVLYRRYGEAPTHREGLALYGLHAIGSLQLGSSAEQDLEGGASRQVRNTIEVNAELYFPFYHSVMRLDRSLSDYIGFIFAYGTSKSQLEAHANSRLYGGFRNAFNPETYIDLLVGRTQGLHSKRFELRAHIPVYKFEHGSRIFFGSVFNTALPWEKDETDERDVYRFYLEWNADFGKILEGVTSVVGL